MIEIYEYTVDEFVEIDDTGEMSKDINKWSCGLWFDEWEQSGVEKIYLAWDDNDIVGFQTINSDNETIAIEVKDSHKGQGLSRSLISESGSYIPERDENPSFWQWAKENFAD